MSCNTRRREALKHFSCFEFPRLYALESRLLSLVCSKCLITIIAYEKRQLLN